MIVLRDPNRTVISGKEEVGYSCSIQYRAEFAMLCEQGSRTKGPRGIYCGGIPLLQKAQASGICLTGQGRSTAHKPRHQLLGPKVIWR